MLLLLKNHKHTHQLKVLKTELRQKLKQKLRQKLKKRSKYSGGIQGIIHLCCSFNNTIISLSDLSGNIKSWTSCGSAGFKGAKRSSKFAGQAAIEKLSKKAKEYGYTKVILHLNGLGRARKTCIKSLKKFGVYIRFIKDFTPISFNGCRPSKFRRL
jgi:small subunit ribosomal protein S11